MDDKTAPTAPPDRQNGQGEHHGVPHSPDAFDVLNPAKQTPPDDAPSKPSPSKP